MKLLKKCDRHEEAVRRRLRQFAHYIGTSWEAKKRTATGISTPHIERIFDLAKSAGALAGKMSAPAARFAMFVVDSRQATDVVRALLRSGGEVKNCHFTEGDRGWRLDWKPRQSRGGAPAGATLRRIDPKGFGREIGQYTKLADQAEGQSRVLRKRSFHAAAGGTVMFCGQWRFGADSEHFAAGAAGTLHEGTRSASPRSPTHRQQLSSHRFGND